MKTNSKMFWQYLKGCGSNSAGMNEISYNQQVIVDDAEKASCLNNYFQFVFLPKYDCNCLSPVSTVPIMQPVELSVSGIEVLLKSIDETKANGPDGISPRVLKRCAHPISLYLYLIYAKSLSVGLLPNDWKAAHIVPIHKGSSRKDVENYRPISLTSISCKVIEHILYTKIINHMTKKQSII